MNTDKKQNAADEGRGIPIPSSHIIFLSLI